MGVTKGSRKIGGGIKFSVFGGADLHEDDELWLRLRVFFPNGFDFTAGSGHLKWIRVDEENASGSGTGRFDWRLKHEVTLENNYNCNPCADGFGGLPPKGRWVTYEIYYKFSVIPVDQGGKGRTLVWEDGKLIGDNTLIPPFGDDTYKVPSIRFIDNWNDGAPQTQHLYIDDIAITNETPSNRDSAGNPYIGVGDFVTVAPPLPPTIR
ncbi:MAG: hypothetical protein KAJ10_10810 [Thermodesulfovibrionia bacterium]|nr:hypothetical protein [Thermodesulfovibrionia bacterium]